MEDCSRWGKMITRTTVERKRCLKEGYLQVLSSFEVGMGIIIS